MKKVLLSLTLVAFAAAGTQAIAQDQNKKDKKKAEQSTEVKKDQQGNVQQDQPVSNPEQKAPDGTQQADPNQQPAQQQQPNDSQQAPAPGTTPAK